MPITKAHQNKRLQQLCDAANRIYGPMLPFPERFELGVLGAPVIGILARRGDPVYFRCFFNTDHCSRISFEHIPRTGERHGDTLFYKPQRHAHLIRLTAMRYILNELPEGE